MKIKSLEQTIEEITILRYHKGYATVNILKYLKDKYGIEDTQAYKIIKIMRKKIGELHRKLNDNVLEDAISFLEDMKQRAVDSGDNKLALQCQIELGKMQQLYIQSIDVTSKGKEITGININIIKPEDGD